MQEELGGEEVLEQAAVSPENPGVELVEAAVPVEGAVSAESAVSVEGETHE